MFITPTMYILEVHTHLAQTAKDLLSQLDMKEPLLVTATCIMSAYTYTIIRRQYNYNYMLLPELYGNIMYIMYRQPTGIV